MFIYLLWACLNDVITTPTLLEQCGMCGSCCIDALEDIVLKLMPPSDPNTDTQRDNEWKWN
jgi:hypothetical protein